MELKPALPQDVLSVVLGQLGLSEDIDPISVETLACLLRHGASVMCPTSPQSLVTAATEAFQPLVSADDLRGRCRAVLDELIAHGDLVEFEDISHAVNKRLLYLSPPSFVRLNDSQALILGVSPDGVDPAPNDIRPMLKGVRRLVSGVDNPTIVQKLVHAGLYELPYSVWAKAPDPQPFDAIIESIDDLLERQPSSDDIEGLRVLNWAIRSRWYRERWEGPGHLTGRYVATRPQRYGADLWCYVELESGSPRKLVDLPVGRTFERGCDQAWRLQCALDASHGAPQQFHVTPLGDNSTRVTIHIPCPAWLLRRWGCVSERANHSVFAFDFAPEDAKTEMTTLKRELWMEPKPE